LPKKWIIKRQVNMVAHGLAKYPYFILAPHSMMMYHFIAPFIVINEMQ